MIDQTFFDHKQTLHFIGIGGSGMYPIVQIMRAQGFHITGSDNNEGDIIDQERKLGIEVMMGHHPENVRGADAVIYSAAIQEDNIELVAAGRKVSPPSSARRCWATSPGSTRTVSVFAALTAKPPPPPC